MVLCMDLQPFKLEYSIKRQDRVSPGRGKLSAWGRNMEILLKLCFLIRKAREVHVPSVKIHQALFFCQWNISLCVCCTARKVFPEKEQGGCNKETDSRVHSMGQLCQCRVLIRTHGENHRCTGVWGEVSRSRHIGDIWLLLRYTWILFKGDNYQEVKSKKGQPWSQPQVTSNFGGIFVSHDFSGTSYLEVASCSLNSRGFRKDQ